MTVLDNYSHFTERSSRIRTPSVLDYIRLSNGLCDLTLGDGRSFLSTDQLAQLIPDIDDFTADLKYGNVQGFEPLREAISIRHNTQSDKIVITVGASEAVFLVLGCIVERGRKVLLPRPAFPAYEAAVRFWGGEVVPYDLLSSNNYSMRPLIERIGQDISALIINSPHNPTGSCISHAEFSEVLDRAGKFGCWVLSDEVYDEFHFDDSHHNSLFDVITPDSADRHVLIHSLSKRLSMPGLRVGYTITNNPKLIDKIVDIKTHSSMGTSIVAQQTALKAMQLVPERSIIDIAKTLQDHRNLLARAFARSDVAIVLPQGGFYLMISDPQKAHDETILYRHFQGIGIAGLPGSVFNSPEPSLRLCLLVPTSRIETAYELIWNANWRGDKSQEAYHEA